MGGATKRVAVVGGAGYIGSHMVRALLAARLEPVVFDNLSTGRRGLVPRGVRLIEGDARDARDLARLFARRPDAVMHFAASSIVPESVERPLFYYENNVGGCVSLLKAMTKAGVKRFVFSSTAAVYGEPRRTPILENHPTAPVNPYGRTKLVVEGLLREAAVSDGLSSVILRYFNAAGAHSDGSAGECHDPETHLIPRILKAVAKPRGVVEVFGRDYPTRDGTCVRDFIHVEDIAAAHLAALSAFRGRPGAEVFNLGTGRGHTVLEVIHAAERATGCRARVKFMPRRKGDPAVLVASARKAGKVLRWRPRKTLEDMIRTAWAWERRRSA